MTSGAFHDRRALRTARKKLLLAALQNNRERPLPAIELAYECGAVGRLHETKRRRVRELIAELHEEGWRICADSHATRGGYWLARGATGWAGYQESAKRKERFNFAAISRRAKAVVDRMNEQKSLFGDDAGARRAASWATA